VPCPGVIWAGMTVTFRVFKKSSSNGRVTLYLGRRDFVDHVTGSDPVDGVLLVEREFLNDKIIFVQLVCSFRYGREEEETMGLNFRKELTLGEVQIFPPSSNQPAPTRLQERLLSKLGKDAFPFHLNFPPHSPNSVTLAPGAEEAGEPCGVEYYVRGVVQDATEKTGKRSSVNLSVRKIQFAPTRPGRQPSTTVRKDFMFSPGELELEVTLDRQLYHHGDDVRVSFVLRNNSNKTVKRINVGVVQCIDIAMFTGGHHTARITEVDTTDGCPIGPGSTLQKEVSLSPTARKNMRPGVALDGRVKGDDTSLASSTLLADENNRDIFGLVVSYAVKVKLFLGAIGGEVTAELPFVLMHPKPDMRRMIKADTLTSVDSFRTSQDDQIYPDDSSVVGGEDMEMVGLTRRIKTS